MKSFMEKAVIVIGSIFLLFLCFADWDPIVSTLKKEEVKKVIKKIEVTFPKESTASYYKWTILRGSDGHDYLESDGGHSYNMMHYIECKKCKTK